MLAGIPHARIERFERAGHFIMLDEPQTFMEILHDFLNGETQQPEMPLIGSASASSATSKLAT
jgi:hypothetical protein